MGTLTSKDYLSLKIGCYELVQKVYADLGRILPPFWSKGLPDLFERISLEDARPYDLILFTSPEFHVGICWKDNKFLQSTGRRVNLAQLSVYKKWVEAVYRWRM